MSTLGDLFEAVRDSFADDGGTASVVFGERETGRQDNAGAGGASRIVFVPFEGDQVGSVEPGEEDNPGLLRVSCTLYVWAIDPDNPEDELAQYNATRALLGALFVYLWRLSAGAITFGKVSRVRAQERSDGAEWKCTFTLRDDLVFEQYTITTEPLVPAPRFVFTLPGA
jgi:hypothetical protein